jgi:hypothetical protein
MLWCAAPLRRFGFVVYYTRAEAQLAVETLAGQELPDHTGRRVNVSAIDCGAAALPGLDV